MLVKIFGTIATPFLFPYRVLKQLRSTKSKKGHIAKKNINNEFYRKRKNNRNSQNKRKSSIKGSKKWLVVKLLAVGCLIIIAIGFFLIILYPKFIVSNIECQMAETTCDETILASVRVAVGKNPIEALKSADKALSSLSFLESRKIKYLFPDKISVLVVRKSAVISLKSTSNWIAEVDESGYVTRLVDSTSLPLITIDRPLVNPGERIAQDVLFAESLVLEFNKAQEIEKAFVRDSYLLVKNKNENINYIFPLEGDARYFSGAYEIILSRLNMHDKEFTIEKSEISEIDFRYKYPVIRRIATVNL